MTAEADELLGGDKVEPFKFDKHGATVTGVILSTERKQQKEFGTGELKFWSSGQPMEQVKITLQTDLRDPANEDDDGRRTVWAKSKMMDAIQAAISRARFKKPYDGYLLTVTYTGDDKPAGKGLHGAKLFSAEIAAADYDPGTEPF